MQTLERIQKEETIAEVSKFLDLAGEALKPKEVPSITIIIWSTTKN